VKEIFVSPIGRFVDRDMVMRHYPGLGVGHMHVHSPEIPQNFDPNGDEVNPMEYEEAEADIDPTDVAAGESDTDDDSDHDGEDDLDESGDERWEDVEDEEIYALHEMYDR
jgi:hypothetical protein